MAEVGNRKTSVLILIRSLYGGGAQRVMIRLGNALSRRGFRVSIATLASAGAFSDELSPDVEMIRLAGGRLMFALPALVRVLRRGNFDLLVSTEATCNNIALLAARVARVRTKIVIREGLYPSVALNASQHTAIRIGYRLAPYTYPRADKIIALTSEIKADLCEHFRVPDRKIVSLPLNPVVSSVMLRASRASAPHPWFEADMPPVIVSVGRLERQKDHQTLLKAFARVRSERLCRLVIIGEGSERSLLESKVRELGLTDDVLLPGFIAMPYAYLGHAAVFVLSSIYEGLPNALIEALACGAPVVSTNCPSGPYDILRGGEIGPLVPIGDSAAMAAAIRTTLDNPRHSSFYRARGLDFRLARSVSAYSKVFHEVLC